MCAALQLIAWMRRV